MPSSADKVRWESPVSEVRGVGDKRLRALRSLGIKTVADLLWSIPRRYEDRRGDGIFPPDCAEGWVRLKGQVTAMPPVRFLPGRRRLVELRIEPPDQGLLGAEPVLLRWLNVFHIRKQVAVGMEINVFGKIEKKGRSWIIWFPEFEIVEADDTESPAGLHLGRLVPIHPAGSGIGTRLMRLLIWNALETLDANSLPPLPSQAADSGVLDVWRNLHFPESMESAAEARRSLAFEEAIALRAELARRRLLRDEEQRLRRSLPSDLTARLIENLPFKPTNAQARAVEEIRADLSAPRPMARLLQGDVGSGKTLVAAAAITDVLSTGKNAVLMAPTQILAEQHYATFKRWLAPLNVAVTLRTGSVRMEHPDDAASESSATLFDTLPGGKAGSLLIGTHALLHTAAHADTGLVVIDEQHRFGVEQRSRLLDLAGRPDLLVMSATPIPRTLTLAFYGDLDLSVLDELPPGRTPVRTAIRNPKQLEPFFAFLQGELSAGRQAYLVHPFVEESEKSPAGAVTKEFKHWVERLQPHPCAMLHGRLPPSEKESVISKFREGRVSALVSTTVIEVGVDVPNASIMAIFDADRFGLSQLHQLRGRVGRGAAVSYCALVTSSEDESVLERLRVLERTNDGFEIAEADLRLRGAGRLLGTEQSGATGLRLLDPATDAAVMERAVGWVQEHLAARKSGSEARTFLDAIAQRAIASGFVQPEAEQGG